MFIDAAAEDNTHFGRRSAMKLWGDKRSGRGKGRGVGERHEQVLQNIIYILPG